jgi:hypothetical protein
MYNRHVSDRPWPYSLDHGADPDDGSRGILTGDDRADSRTPLVFRDDARGLRDEPPLSIRDLTSRR